MSPEQFGLLIVGIASLLGIVVAILTILSKVKELKKKTADEDYATKADLVDSVASLIRKRTADDDYATKGDVTAVKDAVAAMSRDILTNYATKKEVEKLDAYTHESIHEVRNQLHTIVCAGEVSKMVTKTLMEKIDHVIGILENRQTMVVPKAKGTA